MKEKQLEEVELPVLTLIVYANSLFMVIIMQRIQQWDINDSRTASIHKKLDEMIAIDCQPVSIVEDIGFNCFIKAIEPQYTIPR